MASTRLRALGLYVHYQELVSTWTRKLSNRHEAEDLSQEAVLRMLEARVAPEHPRAYLHQTARNLAVDAFRKQDGREPRAVKFYTHSGVDVRSSKRCAGARW